MSTQSTNTARRFVREFQTQTSVESLAQIPEEPPELPPKPETPIVPSKVWGPIDFPIAEITKVTQRSCEVKWQYQENATYYITSCIQMFNEANSQQILRHDASVTTVSLIIMDLTLRSLKLSNLSHLKIVDFEGK